MTDIMEPPVGRHARVITANVWQTVGGEWRWDVQHPGPPKSRSSGNRHSEAAALQSAAEELLRMAGEAL